MMAVEQASFVGKGGPSPAPVDFDEMFVRIGRLQCEAHYKAPRLLIDAWLRQRGKKRLLELRAEHVTKMGEESSGAVARYGRETVDGWRAEGLSRSDMGRIISAAIPVSMGPLVSETLAREAAHFLREVRNGGHYVSPIGDGDWLVGLARKSAADLLAMAKAKGFQPASLTGDGETKVG